MVCIANALSGRRLLNHLFKRGDSNDYTDKKRLQEGDSCRLRIGSCGLPNLGVYAPIGARVAAYAADRAEAARAAEEAGVDINILDLIY